MTAERNLEVIALGPASLELHAQQLGAPLEAATSFAASVGGSAARVALGLTRLGVATALAARVGDDPAGAFVIEALAAEGCEVSHVARDRERATALAMIGGGAQHAYRGTDLALGDAALDEAFLARARALVVTGTAPAHYVSALERARRHGVRTVLDVGGAPVAIADLRRFDLVVGTRAELQRIGGREDLVAALRQIRGATQAILVVKLGASGCAVFEAEIPARIEASPAASAATGDAFLTGLVTGWLGGMDLPAAGRHGDACAALVAARAMAALPTAAELAYWQANRPPRHDRDPQLARLHRASPRRRTREDLCLISIDDRTQAYELARAAGAPEARLAVMKQLIVRGLAEAEQAMALHGRVGALIDDTYGGDAQLAAAGRHWWLARPVEVPGSSPLEFEGGRSIGSRLIAWPGDCVVKCLVQLHPDEPVDHRLEQETQLAALWQAVLTSGHELLLEVIPPRSLPSDGETVVRAVKRLYNLGLCPEWWGLEALPAASWRMLDQLIAERDPHCRGVLLIDRGDGAAELAVAAASRSCRGLFVGRHTLRAPSAEWLAGTLDDAGLIARVRAAIEQRVRAWDTARRARAERT